jgi:hypothetical protein
MDSQNKLNQEIETFLLASGQKQKIKCQSFPLSCPWQQVGPASIEAEWRHILSWCYTQQRCLWELSATTYKKPSAKTKESQWNCE